MAYGDGFDTPGNAFHQWDAVSRRRYAASRMAPRSSWDVPHDWQPQAEGAASGGVTAPALTGAPSGMAVDPQFRAYRDSALQDAAAHASGARLTAMDAAPNDPSLAAYAGLSGELGGQSQASHDVNSYAAHYLDEQSQRAWQEHMARLQYQLAEEQMRKQNAGAWAGDLGQILGGIGGAWLAPGGLFKGAA